MSRLRTELASAYAVTAARVGAWAVVSAMVFRAAGETGFAEVSVARAGVALLGYVGAAIGPVLLRRLIEAAALPAPEQPEARSGSVIEYARPGLRRELTSEDQVYLRGRFILSLAVIYVGMAILVTGSLFPPNDLLFLDSHGFFLLLPMTLGMALRVMGESAGAWAQSRGGITRDNIMVAISECTWPLCFYLVFIAGPPYAAVRAAGIAFALSGLTSVLLRGFSARALWKRPFVLLPDPVAPILRPAALLLLGNIADFFYAPTNLLLMGWLSLSASFAVSAYAPAVQVDGALLLLTTAVSAIILPRATKALVAGDVATVRRYYLTGTLACAAVLTLAAIPVAIFADRLLHLWLGAGLPRTAPAVLQLVLIHTVIGGSSGIGRAVILAAGRYKTYAATALAFGLANATGVTLVLWLTNWGVRGVVVVTVVTVTLRCAVWMPWYTLRLLRNLKAAEIPKAKGNLPAAEPVPAAETLPAADTLPPA